MMMKTLASLRSDSWTTSAGSGGHLPPDYPDNFTGLRTHLLVVSSLLQGGLKRGAQRGDIAKGMGEHERLLDATIDRFKDYVFKIIPSHGKFTFTSAEQEKNLLCLEPPRKNPTVKRGKWVCISDDSGKDEEAYNIATFGTREEKEMVAMLKSASKPTIILNLGPILDKLWEVCESRENE